MRKRSADLFVRYVGGDLSLIPEVVQLRAAQEAVPEEHPARVFGREVERETPQDQLQQIVQLLVAQQAQVAELSRQVAELQAAPLERRQVNLNVTSARSDGGRSRVNLRLQNPEQEAELRREVLPVSVYLKLGDGGGESALVVVSSSPSSVFVSGDGGDLELGVKLFVAAVTVCFCFGRAGERVSFGGGVVVAVVCFCFGGRWRFGVGCETVRRRRHRLFLFWAGGGASQPWCRRRRLFLFRAGGGASQLWCRRRRLFLFRGTVAIWSWV